MDELVYYSLTLALCLAAILSLSSLRRSSSTVTTGAGKQIKQPPPLPPGPAPPLTWLLAPLLSLDPTNLGVERAVRAARSRYGPVFTLHLQRSRPTIFIADRAVAHRALVQHGAAFAGREPPPPSGSGSVQLNINGSGYGRLWRALRRNLAAACQPLRLRRYAGARRRAAAGLVAAVEAQMDRDGAVVVEGLLYHALFRVNIAMCFGDGLDDDDALVASLEALHGEVLASSSAGFRQVLLGLCPAAVAKVLFRRRWESMVSLRRRHEELYLPLIRARRDAAAGDDSYSYVDSLHGLRIPDGSGGVRKLTEDEMVSLCFEFVVGSIDSLLSVSQWIMAHLVAQPEIQARLRDEIHHHQGHLVEEDLPRMPYLGAVVQEALRLHPPGQLLKPHAVAAVDEADGGYATLEGFRVPSNASVNVAVGLIGLDDAVWPDARRFRPERFLHGGDGEDSSKMMPFGAGPRICPAMPLAMLHVPFFVATLVAEFQWLEVAGEPVDFAEKQDLSVVMRRPLRARVVRCNC